MTKVLPLLVLTTLLASTLTNARLPPGAPIPGGVGLVPEGQRRGLAKTNFNAADLPAQRERALESLLKNVFPADTRPGTVVAAISRVNPPYFFHWVRDAALVMRALVDEYANPETSAERVAFLEKTLWDFVGLTQFQQSRRSPSADERFNDPFGITEPKYYVSGEPYDNPWGRPQDDGPPLRALTFIDFALEYIRRTGDTARVLRELYVPTLPARSPLKQDLEVTAYTAGKRTSFELWEEVKGLNFHTTMAQYRALKAGAKFAAEVAKEQGAADFYAQEAARLERDLLPRFWDQGRNYALATIDRDGGLDWKASNLDVAILLGSNHADTLATRVSERFELPPDTQYLPDDPRVLATALALHRAHREAFEINRSWRPDLPPAIGRYTEDRYYGGNPWFLTTFGAAEQHFRAALRFCAKKSIEVTPVSLAFWNDVLAANGNGAPTKVGTYALDTTEAARLLTALSTRADGYIARAQQHWGAEGAMDEQIDRRTGFMISARDLTWSYSSFITLIRARERAVATCGAALGSR